MSTTSTCIVVPCYNEQSRLDPSLFEVHAKEHRQTSFLFVNDGSRDDTLAVLKRLRCTAGEQISVLDLAKNGGKAEAVRKGLLQALGKTKCEYVGFWDADLATPLEAIDRFVAVMENREELLAVVGSRVRLLGRHIDRQPLRHYLGRVFATAASVVLQLPIYDTQCGAKLFRRSAGLCDALQTPFTSRWIFDVELLARLIAVSGRSAVQDGIFEYPLECWKDVAGSSVKAADFIKAAGELGRIYFTYRQRDMQHPSRSHSDSHRLHIPVT